MDNLLLTAGSSPHIKDHSNTRRIMTDVIIALIPAIFLGIYRFGWYAAAIILVAVLAAVGSEWLFAVLTKKEHTITDGSAVVSALLLALTLPPRVPLWIPVFGSVFAILIVKCVFGGIGNNFVNPALAARAMLAASWPVHMTTFTEPVNSLIDFSGRADIVSVATPLSDAGSLTNWPADISGFGEKLLGNSAGAIGEVSLLAIAIGAAYLIWRKVIRLEAPLACLLSFSFFAWLWQGAPDQLFRGNVPGELMFGGILFASIFMVTDYSTTPMSKKGQIIFGVSVGFLTVVIRHFGDYPEGVTYAILLMNLCVPLIDRLLVPKSFLERRAKHV